VGGRIENRDAAKEKRMLDFETQKPEQQEETKI